MAEQKKCPYCAEDIKKEAIKCRFCGEWLEEGKDTYVDQEKEQEDLFFELETASQEQHTNSEEREKEFIQKRLNLYNKKESGVFCASCGYEGTVGKVKSYRINPIIAVFLGLVGSYVLIALGVFPLLVIMLLVGFLFVWNPYTFFVCPSCNLEFERKKT